MSGANASGDVVVIGADDVAIASIASVLRTLAVPVRIVRAPSELRDGEIPSVMVIHGHPVGTSAIDLVRSIRARRGVASPRFVWIPTAEPRRVELVHVDDVVRRPYRAVDLVQRVQRLLRRSGMHPSVGVELRRQRGHG